MEISEPEVPTEEEVKRTRTHHHQAAAQVMRTEEQSKQIKMREHKQSITAENYRFIRKEDTFVGATEVVNTKNRSIKAKANKEGDEMRKCCCNCLMIQGQEVVFTGTRMV